MKKVLVFVSVVILSAVVALVWYGRDKKNSENDMIYISGDTDSVIVEPEIKREFGIAVDSFEIVTGRIKRNQRLGEILNDYSINTRQINDLVNVSKDIFDVRKIRFGNNYNLYLEKDSAKTLKHFVYQHTPLEYFIIDFQDSVRVRKGIVPTDTVQKTGVGVVNISLWETIKENKMNPNIALKLEDIYAWTVDFFGLQKGDSFKVVYDEIYVHDTISVGVGNVHAAFFRHAGKDLYAIPFEQDGEVAFYDQDGKSLKKAFLKAPLNFTRISSGYSHARFHPILKRYRPHHGIDYAAPIGTPVRTIGDGKVIKAQYSGGAGKMVKIQHNSSYASAYLHLNGYGKNIKAGAYVKQGDIIGYVGSTGLSTGPHLDFRLYRNGYAINPLTYEAPPVEPVKKENLARFDSVKNEIITNVLKGTLITNNEVEEEVPLELGQR